MEKVLLKFAKLMDHMSDSDKDTFVELLTKAFETKKATAPKRTVGPRTTAQKISATEKRLAKEQALLAKLLAGDVDTEDNNVVEDDEDVEDYE